MLNIMKHLIELDTDSLRINPNNFTTNCYIFFSFGERENHGNLLINIKVEIGMNKDTAITYVLNETRIC